MSNNDDHRNTVSKQFNSSNGHDSGQKQTKEVHTTELKLEQDNKKGWPAASPETKFDIQQDSGGGSDDKCSEQSSDQGASQQGDKTSWS